MTEIRRSLEIVLYTDYLSIEMFNQHACPGVVFNTAMLIDYSEAEPRVKSNFHARAKNTESSLLIHMPIPRYQDIDNPVPRQARMIRRMHAAITSCLRDSFE